MTGSRGFTVILTYSSHNQMIDQTHVSRLKRRKVLSLNQHLQTDRDDREVLIELNLLIRKFD